MRKSIFAVIAVSVLASLSACNKDSGGEDWGGFEHITFEVAGVVLNMDGKPLNNIAVTTADSDTVRTDASGFYKVSGISVPLTSMTVYYIDTDGDANGGKYLKTSRLVELEFKGGEHGPYLGKYEAKGVEVGMMTEATITPDVPDLQ